MPKRAKPGQTVLIRAVAGDKRAIGDWGLELKPARVRHRLARGHNRRPGLV